MLLYLVFTVQVLFMLGLPVALALFLRWRWGLRWKLFWVGCLTFVGSQVVHIPLVVVEKLGLEAIGALTWPFPVLVFVDALLLGLMAGICEEPARYLGYRFLLRKERRWRESLMFGVGHGGIESVIAGIVVLVNVVVISWLANTDLASLGLVGTPAEQVQQQIDAFLVLPPYVPILGGLERLWAILLHLSLTVLVWRTLTTRRWRYFLAAIGWHWLVDTGAMLILVGTDGNVLVTEAMVAVAGLLSLGFVWWSRRWAGEEAPPGEAATSEVLETPGL